MLVEASKGEHFFIRELKAILPELCDTPVACGIERLQDPVLAARRGSLGTRRTVGARVRWVWTKLDRRLQIAIAKASHVSAART